MRAAIRHHLTTWRYSSNSRHRVWYMNADRPVPGFVRRMRFRAIVLHTTFLCMRWSHLFYFWKWNLRWINQTECLKIAFPQDEYDHSEVLDEWLEEMGVHVIFSNFGPEHHATLYPRTHQRARFILAYTGYIDHDTARAVAPKIRPLASRPLDIVYRAFKLPYWFGSHGQRKSSIASEILARIEGRGLATDISTRPEDVIVGDSWFDFMASGRCVIGCESGSSVLDRRGEIQALIRHMFARNPDLTFEEASRALPAGWDDHRFFAISPRHFEAVLTKTAQILIEGQYNGVLIPDRHYISLKSDFSNLDQVVERIRDHAFLQGIVDTAYREVYLEGRNTYQHLAETIDSVLSEFADTAERNTVLSSLIGKIVGTRSMLAPV